MTERRYDDTEVAAILARAADLPANDSATGAREGLTLAQLQEIAREVGIPAESIAVAARNLENGRPMVTRRLLGAPVTVAHTISLGRRLTPDEWERIVVLLREVFEARGRLGGEGGLRQWTNGNLQVMLEPTDSGDRLRLRTTKGNATSSMMIGIGLALFSATYAGAASALAWTAEPVVGVTLATIGAFGTILSGAALLRLPKWAETRRQQMQAIADRLLRDVSARGDVQSLPADPHRVLPANVGDAVEG